MGEALVHPGGEDQPGHDEDAAADPEQPGEEARPARRRRRSPRRGSRLTRARVHHVTRGERGATSAGLGGADRRGGRRPGRDARVARVVGRHDRPAGRDRWRTSSVWVSTSSGCVRSPTSTTTVRHVRLVSMGVHGAAAPTHSARAADDAGVRLQPALPGTGAGVSVLLPTDGTRSHSSPRGTWPMYHVTGIVAMSPLLRSRIDVASSTALASWTAGGRVLGPAVAEVPTPAGVDELVGAGRRRARGLGHVVAAGLDRPDRRQDRPELGRHHRRRRHGLRAVLVVDGRRRPRAPRASIGVNPAGPIHIRATVEPEPGRPPESVSAGPVAGERWPGRGRQRRRRRAPARGSVAIEQSASRWACTQAPVRVDRPAVGGVDLDVGVGDRSLRVAGVAHPGDHLPGRHRSSRCDARRRTATCRRRPRRRRRACRC